LTIDPTIRPYCDEDAPALHAAALESVEQVFPWLPWCHPGYTIQEARDWARTRRELFERGAEYEFAIVDQDGRFLGGCGLNQIQRAHKMANLGYWVRTSATGRGVATAAVRQAARFALERTDLVRLEILCAVGNLGSRRVAEKAGAVREAVLGSRLFLHGRPHDAVVYAILRPGASGRRNGCPSNPAQPSDL